MNCRVKITPTALKERKRLEQGIRKRIDSALKSLGKAPRPAGAKKLAGGRNDWRIRVGDYRILYG
ncbi:MAG: type II toxin-antitoxin system RelE/ParE family toxin, partial [Acidobacteriota bacterium]